MTEKTIPLKHYIQARHTIQNMADDLNVIATHLQIALDEDIPKLTAEEYLARKRRVDNVNAKSGAARSFLQHTKHLIEKEKDNAENENP